MIGGKYAQTLTEIQVSAIFSYDILEKWLSYCLKNEHKLVYLLPRVLNLIIHDWGFIERLQNHLILAHYTLGYFGPKNWT